MFIQKIYLITLKKVIFILQWIPPPVPEKVRDAEEQITIDLGDEYEQALTSASQEEIIDLAGKTGFCN